MPGFSILVAVYNAEQFLDQCLQSLLAQTFQDWQAICIDDCSTDSSWKLLQRYAEQDSRFVVLRTSVNSGQAVARNLGLSQAAGEFTLMLDADDFLAADALQTLWEVHVREPLCDAILFNLTRVWEDGTKKPWEWPDERRILSGQEACLLSINWQIHGCFAYHTTLHKKYPYDTTFRVYSDDTTSRIHLLKSQKVALTEGVYYYRQHETSCTHQFSMRLLDFMDANRLLCHRLEKENIGEKGLQIAEDMFWKNYVGIYREFYEHHRLFSKEEQNRIDQRFIAAMKEMHPKRISSGIKKIPAYYLFSSYRMFSLWQRLLLGLRRICKH